MSETRWTKGPWEVTYEAGDFDESVGVSMASHQEDPGYYKTAHLWHSDCEPDCKETVANAHLIAAAPELYEALASIENDDGSIPKAIWDMRNAALAKARGE